MSQNILTKIFTSNICLKILFKLHTRARKHTYTHKHTPYLQNLTIFQITVTTMTHTRLWHTQSRHNYDRRNYDTIITNKIMTHTPLWHTHNYDTHTIMTHIYVFVVWKQSSCLKKIFSWRYFPRLFHEITKKSNALS